ncbi:hypothetical protein [Paenibacillus radicis (ex Xue et al. 2023)]|uniref:FUSC family protein n=1 Tax=Paenibacillus radicis (ex Xue et al. 2023) TaxID=2972489 RepID=A0ABT1YSS0_9BACL|nr:hypothetical protein [Paenibacillus radicis (ex Xue et al. 2023)]MCR8635338.1 hypothetical protein [Paenibacillus radicis (ex Xue et al. 2023)]
MGGFNLTFWIGIVYSFAAIVRACGYTLNTIAVVAFSVSAVFISVKDLLEQMRYKHLNIFSAIISALVAFFILLPPLLNPQVSDEYKDVLAKIGDVATILGLGIVLITIGIKHSQFLLNLMQSLEKLTREKMEKANPKYQYQVVKEMATQEYKMMISINDIILELKKRDNTSFPVGRGHDGWSLFYDTLGGFEIHGGPFYDLLLERLFWDFVAQVNIASYHFSAISDPDTQRSVGHVLMWGTEMEVHNYRDIPYHKGFNEGVEAVKKAIEVWDELKENAMRLYEKHGIHE